MWQHGSDWTKLQSHANLRGLVEFVLVNSCNHKMVIFWTVDQRADTANVAESWTTSCLALRFYRLHLKHHNKLLTAANVITVLLQTQTKLKAVWPENKFNGSWSSATFSSRDQRLLDYVSLLCWCVAEVAAGRHIWPAVFTFDEQVVSRQAAMTPARHCTVLLWGAVAVGRVLFCYFVIAGATCHAIEIHAGNDGLGKRRGRWGGGRGRAIVVILTTHNGRLLHLQTTGVQAKRETENGDEWKWGQNNRCVKQYSC